MQLPKLRELKEALTSFFSAPYTTKYPAGPAASFPPTAASPSTTKITASAVAPASWCALRGPSRP